MTQVDIRVCVLLFSCMMAISLICTTLFLRDTGLYILRHEYRQEMLRRSAYVTAMLEWLPSITLFGAKDFERIQKDTPFTVTALSPSESDVRGITMSEDNPFTVLQYSEPLNVVISIHELFSGYFQFGCPGEVLIIGTSYAMCTIALVVACVLSANVLARHCPRLATPYSQIIVVAALLLLPLGMDTAMIATIVRTQAKCATRAWEDDIRRTSMLVARVYAILDLMYVNSFPISLLESTFKELNTHFISSQKYSMHVVNYTSKAFHPPLPPGRDAVRDILLSADAADIRFALYVPSTNDVISTYPVKQQQCLVAVVQNADDELPKVSSGDTRLAFMLLLGSQALFSLIAIAFFPYKSLGRLTAAEAESWQGPWAWRASSRWPTWKIFQAMVIIVFTVGTLSYYVEKLSSFYDVSNLFFSSMRTLVEGGIDLSVTGRRLLTTYTHLFNTLDWSAAWIETVNNGTEQDRVEVNRFYQAVFRVMSLTEYSATSVPDMAAALHTPSDLPLLKNTPGITTILRKLQSEHLDTTELEAAIAAWDCSMLVSILLSSTEGLRRGSQDFKIVLLEVVADLDRNSVDFMGMVITATLNNAHNLASVAESWSRQNNSVVAEGPALYRSPEGKRVVQLERQSVTDQQAQWSGSQFRYDSIYVFASTDVCLFIAATVLIMGLLSFMDYVYMAVFYGSCPWGERALWSATHKRFTGTTPSNDYTAPSSSLAVNYHHVWSGIRQATASTCVIVGLCLVCIFVTTVTVDNAMTSLLSRRVFNDQISRPIIEDAYSTGLTSIVVVEWMRAYISRTAEDITAAVMHTIEWDAVKDTKWVDSPPSRNKMDYGAVAESNEVGIENHVRQMANLVGAQGIDTGDVQTVYEDFALRLQDASAFFSLIELYQCLPLNDFKKFADAIDVLMMMYLYMAPDDDARDAAYTDITDVHSANTRCFNNGDTEDIHRYLRQLYRLRERTAFFPSRQKLADSLQKAAEDATEAYITEIRLGDEAEPETGLSTSPIFWGPVVLAWVCVPFVYRVYVAAQRIHIGLYFS